MTTDPNRPASFGQCAICHSVREDGPVLIGPHLVGVYGATAGTRGDFAYSQALRQSGLVWNDAALDAYIRSPQTAIRGNRMAYVGEADPAVRAEIIAYLKTLNAKTDE
ncbi:MAG: c-type cytochrome [Pseudomonadota bacterium]